MVMYSEVLDYETPEFVFSLEIWTGDEYLYCTMTAVDLNEEMTP